MEDIEHSVARIKRDCIVQFADSLKAAGIVAPGKDEELEQLCQSYSALATTDLICEAYTKTGKGCTRRKNKGTSYCGIHNKKYNPKRSQSAPVANVSPAPPVPAAVIPLIQLADGSLIDAD